DEEVRNDVLSRPQRLAAALAPRPVPRAAGRALQPHGPPRGVEPPRLACAVEGGGRGRDERRPQSIKKRVQFGLPGELAGYLCPHGLGDAEALPKTEFLHRSLSLPFVGRTGD